MSEENQIGRVLAATDSRTIAVRPTGNPLVARGLTDLSNPVEVPEVTEETASEIRGKRMALVHNAAKRLLVKHGHAPIIEEIAAECGLEVTDIIGIHKSFFADPLYNSCKLAFSAALRTCTYREREIIKLLYGLGGSEHYTCEEVAHIFKVVAKEIRRLERNGVVKILAYFENKDWGRHTQPFPGTPPST